MIVKEYLLQILNKYHFLALALVILPNLLTAEAIVNVEDSRKEGQVGFFTKVSVALNGTRGNIHSNFYSVNLRLDNNSEDLESFLIMQKSQRKRNRALLAESSFVHGRLIFINESKFSTEVFVQQGKNPFRRYAERNVFGVGTRIWELALQLAAKLNPSFRSSELPQVSFLEQKKPSCFVAAEDMSFVATEDMPLLGTQNKCFAFQQETCVLFKQETCVLFQQETCLLLQQDTCLVFQQDTCLVFQSIYSDYPT